MSQDSRLNRILNSINKLKSIFKSKSGESTSSKKTLGREVGDSLQTTKSQCMTNLATGTFTGLIFVLAFAFTAIYNIYSVNSAFAADSSISLSLSSSTLSLDIVPRTTTGDFAKSSSETVTVSSNHYSGYTLSIKANNTTNPTDLIGTTSSTNLLNSLSSDTTESDFSSSTSTSLNDKWGLNFAKNGTTSDVFHPSPSTTGTTIDTTSTSGNNTYNLTIGARASINTPFDSYTNTYVLAVVGNPTPYTITYNQNTEDTVTNMPSPNPETGSVSGNTTDISTTVPARDGYDFKGWCSVPTTNSSNSNTGDSSEDSSGNTASSNSDDTCSGTIYNPDGGGTALSLSLDQTGVNNITIYAMWAEASNKLYDTVANLVKKDGSGKPRTQSVEDLQAEITQPTSTDPSTDTSNSGVYKYDTETFGESSDASNDHDIYYYRGILDTSGHTGSYGSDGEADAYPNYVKLLGSNICWRIVRTTGSGGVKMIYNGTWTGSTCARNQTDAQLSSTGPFDGNSDTYQQAVRVGYGYNSTYASNSTTKRTLTTLFGTNSDFSGNSASSTIKTRVENWYTSNMNNYTNLIEPSAGYCGDRIAYNDSYALQPESTSIRQYATSATTTTTIYFGARVRNAVSNTNAIHPSLTCAKDKDDSTDIDRSTVDLYTASNATNGNKQLAKPASLLTADEASFAGSGGGGSGIPAYHSNSFLRSGSTFWLLSPYYRHSVGYAGVFTLYSNGYLGNYVVLSTYGVRPAISLKNESYIQKGAGTSTDPWIVADTPPRYIQDFTNEMCQAQASSGPVTVFDKRDGNDYTVRYINGNCWMTQNLRFTGSTLEPATSDVTETRTIDWKDLANDSACKDNSSAGTGMSTPCKRYNNNTSYGTYYNYAGVSAGTITGNSNTTEATESVCPANWTLPTNSQQSGITSYTSSFSPVYSGYYWAGSLKGVGSYGDWWSSTAESSTNRYLLDYLSGSGLNNGYTYGRYRGSSARCARK